MYFLAVLYCVHSYYILYITYGHINQFWHIISVSFLFVFFQDFVESTATSPPHLSLMLLHPRHLFHHPRHPFQEESAREQARHEESEAKLAEWWRRCDSPPFSQKLRESVCVCVCVFLGVRVCVFLDACVCIFRCVVQCFLFK